MKNSSDTSPLCRQLITVETESPTSIHAVLTVYHNDGAGWVQTMESIPAVIGKHGIDARKAEGDRKTPQGLYDVGEAFGTAPAPEGTKLPYRIATEHDYWVDDPESDDYNRWVHYEGNPSERWKSFERLTDPLYTHAVVIKYNEDPVVKGKGSAIFLHRWKSGDTPTLGCVAIAYEDLVRLLGVLDPAKHPKINMTVSGQ